MPRIMDDTHGPLRLYPGLYWSFYSDQGCQAGGEPGSRMISIGVTAEVSLSAEVIGSTGQSIAMKFIGAAQCRHIADNCFLG